MRSRLCGAALFALLLSGCRERIGPLPGPPNEEAVPAPTSSARRPQRHYYLGRVQSRCDMFWVDGGDVSPPTMVVCPADLLPGERIRLAGKACLREGSDKERSEPVVCPIPLLALDAAERVAMKRKP
jgi:hypothetical protein